MFSLDAQLAADTFEVGRFELCRVLLMNDARYPWCILVPQRQDIREIHQLGAADRTVLMAESCDLAAAMQHVFSADKLNIAALGNVVAQLHVHHIARYRTDAAWPAPVWGRGEARPYAPERAQERLMQLRGSLQLRP